MRLKESDLRRPQPVAKPTKITDGGGLYIRRMPDGGQWWRFDYRLAGKRKTISLGTYPDVTLSMARQRRDEARRQVATGIDPSAARQATKAAAANSAANSFEVVSREWFANRRRIWSPRHAANVLARLERDLFPWLGKRPVSEISPRELLDTVRRLEARDAVESAHRVLQNAGQIFRYAVATSRCERNPAADLRGALAPVIERHHAAITSPPEIGALLRAIDGYIGSPIVHAALRLAPLLFVRPGELRQMEWTELNLPARQWNIPAEKMKMRQPHLVPLSVQAVQILNELEPLTGSGRYVFPSPRSRTRPISDNAVLSALRRMGYAKDEMTGHGFRAMARTVLDEILHKRPDLIEQQLAHAVRDPNGRAYNRTSHLPERAAMMQEWADYLDGLRDAGAVKQFRRA